MLKRATDFVKCAMGLFISTLAAFAMAPLPNIEPIMATTLPYAKRHGVWVGAAFALIALAAKDYAMGMVGWWTVYAGLAYAGVGFAAGYVLPRLKEVKTKHWVGFAVVGTLAFDLVTALAFGWQFGQPLAMTLIGQIPFTLMHLAGNVALVGVFSPLLSKHWVENKALDAWTLKTGARR